MKNQVNILQDQPNFAGLSVGSYLCDTDDPTTRRESQSKFDGQQENPKIRTVKGPTLVEGQSTSFASFTHAKVSSGNILNFWAF